VLLYIVTGLLVAMDESVMLDALDQAAAWHSEFGATDFSGVGASLHCSGSPQTQT